MTGGGKGANLNVFSEAAIAWEKRQSALRAKAQAEKGWGAFWQPATGSAMQDVAAAAAAAANVSSSLGRGVNAATVAAAARKWRDYQRNKRNRSALLIPVNASSTASLSSTDAAA